MPVNLDIWEAEAGGSQVQPQQHSKALSNLVRPCLKILKRKGWGVWLSGWDCTGSIPGTKTKTKTTNKLKKNKKKLILIFLCQLKIKLKVRLIIPLSWAELIVPYSVLKLSMFSISLDSLIFFFFLFLRKDIPGIWFIFKCIMYFCWIELVMGNKSRLVEGNKRLQQNGKRRHFFENIACKF